MVSETTNQDSLSALLPERYPEHDLFICDVQDAVLKDVMPQMEHPFYALSKKPERAVRRYEHNGNWVEITPSVKGLATIYDKDILIYCISQLMAKLKAGEKVTARVKINSRDLLRFINRGTSGYEYKALIQALDRLEGTRIRTNVRTGNEEQIDGFGLIDASSIRRQHGLDDRLISCEVRLSDWVFNAIRSNEVLTLHRNYFRLRKPLERRVYELARKHCGHQKRWRVSLAVLLKKSGSQSSSKLFRKMIKALAESNHLPDYFVSYEHESDMVLFTNRMAQKEEAVSTEASFFALRGETYKEAKEEAPGWDVYYLEREWVSWLDENEIIPKNPDRHFLKFCGSWLKNHGAP